jgi:hypothetical protein
VVDHPGFDRRRLGHSEGTFGLIRRMAAAKDVELLENFGWPSQITPSKSKVEDVACWL